MDDIKVKCTRCRNSHPKSERNFVLGAATGGVMSRSACPRCGGYSWYDCTPQVAWCWASGLIEIGDAMPADRADGSGAIQIATGPRYALEGQITALARHSRDIGVDRLFVPGVPEAGDPRAAVDALVAWLKRCGGLRRKDGVIFAGREGR